MYVSWQQVPRKKIKEAENNGGNGCYFFYQVDRKSLWAKMTFEQKPEGNEETCATFFY